MPAPQWFWRFLYDRKSAAWGRRRDEAAHRDLVDRTVGVLHESLAHPGTVADLGCGPGAHALALARLGHDVVGLDGSPRMIEVARARAARDGVEARFEVGDVAATLPFPDASLGGVLASLVVQHLRRPERFIQEIRRCLRPGGHLLVVAPSRDPATVRNQSRYWRWRAAGAYRVPGVVRFFDQASLVRLVDAGGFDVVRTTTEPGRVTVLARR